MKTCEDCILDEIYPIALSPDHCLHFKDKSKLIEPSCSIGDTVYVINKFVDKDKCGECKHYLMGDFGNPPECMKTDDGYCAPECLEIEEYKATFSMILHWIQLDLFGKTVFMTQKEAEKKLKELK